MDYFIPLPGTTAPSFASSTLVLPQPSLSSVAQLACDLLVHNCALELVGYLGVRDYVPAVGGRDALPGSDGGGETDSEGLSLGTEVYTNSSRSLTLVLPRAPVIRARKAHHLDAMHRFVAAGGFRDVLVVAGVDAAMRGDEALNAPTPLRHLIPSSSSSSTASSPLFTALQSLAPPYSSPSPSPTSLPSLPHAGLTRSLLSSLSAPSSPAPAPAPRIAALLAYTAEGPSAPLAHELATSLARVLELPLLPGGGWTEPLSWERGLMGVELERDGAGREMFS
ncbi:PAC2 family-domain-containing protein [Rhodotorula diobovata]|uniref:Proteasome assembly chaperone 2 n=1 Tax=Rhodotorula diobovata TaxID=5288 RepID=A0A5C5FMB5_9BASI|nr:PAC2 family-domain-containing protein [Rhodotorula diobovata]